MDEKELKTLNDTLDAINKKQGEIETALTGKVGEKELKDIKTEMTNIKSSLEGLSKIEGKDVAEFVKAIQKQTNTLEETLKEIKLNGAKGIQPTFADELDKFLKSDQYKNLAEKKSDKAIMQTKTTITTANSFTQTNSPIIQYQRDPVIYVEPLRSLALQRIVAQRPIGMTDTVDWAERTTNDNNSANVAEAAQYNAGSSSNLGWTSYKRSVEKITDYVQVSDEKLSDTDFVQGEIMKLLNENIPLKLESNLFDGTGGSNTLYGLIGASLAKAFSVPTGLANMVNKPNRYSALKAAMVQVALGNTSKTKGTGFLTNYILVNPVDYYLMSEEKDENGQYLFGTDGVMRVMGVPVLQTQFLAADTYLVGDFTKADLYTRKGLTIEMANQHDTNFLYGLVTFRADARYCLKVTNVNCYAFVTGTFTNTISAIRKGA